MVNPLTAQMSLGAASALLPAAAATQSAGACAVAGTVAEAQQFSGSTYTPPPLDRTSVQNEATEVSEPPTAPTAEEFALYRRTEELFNAVKKTSNLSMPLDFGMFRHWLHIETLAARFEARPVDLKTFASRIYKIAAYDNSCFASRIHEIAGYVHSCDEKRRSNPYKDAQYYYREEKDLAFDRKGCPDHNPYIAMIRFMRANPGVKQEAFMRAWKAIFEQDDHFHWEKIWQFSGDLGCQLPALDFLERGLECDKKMLASYIDSGMAFHQLMQAVDERAYNLVRGAHLHIRWDDPASDSDGFCYAVERIAAKMVLAPVYSRRASIGEDIFQRIVSQPLDEGVSSWPFVISVLIQRPIQRELHLGVIHDYLNPVRHLMDREAIAGMAKEALRNGAKNGLRVVSSDIKEFLTQYGDGADEAPFDAINAQNVGEFIDCALRALAKHPKAIPGVKFLPDFLIASTILEFSSTELLKPILSFRATAPFDDVVAGLKALHNFYAELIPNRAAHHFGIWFLPPGKFFKRADELLQRELAKIEWMDYERVRMTIVPSRDVLDGFHAYMGDRFCLSSDDFIKNSLTDPRFVPYRMLLHGPRPSETWKGGIYQMTVRARGLKLMILSGIDPQMGFNVNPGELMDELEYHFKEMAQDGDYDLMLVDEIEGSSRKGTMLREIRERYPDRLELSPEEAVGFPVKVPVVDGVPPGPHETDKFYMAHRHFRVMADLRGKKETPAHTKPRS